MTDRPTQEQRERRRRQAQSRRQQRQQQTDVLRTKDGFAGQPVAEIGDHRSVAQVFKDNFDEAVVCCIQDGGFSYGELAARLRHIQRANIYKPDIQFELVSVEPDQIIHTRR